MKKKVLLFGFTGDLGTNLIFFLRQEFVFFLAVHTRKIYFKDCQYKYLFKKKKLDKKKLFEIIKLDKPDIIINCAANTDLDECEKNGSKVNYVNVHLPEILADISKKNNIKFVHISTDHLYNINKKYKSETDKAKGINIYGKQKLKAEKKVLKKNKNSLIIRTNFFAHSIKEKNLFNLIEGNYLKKKKTDLIFDYYSTPIYSKYFSKYLSILVQNNSRGIINIVSNERISKYDFANLYLKKRKIKNFLFNKVYLKNFKFSAQRQPDLSLSNFKLKKILKKKKIKIPSLGVQINEFIKTDKKFKSQVFKKFPYGKHSVSNKDTKNVRKVLLSGFLTQGHHISDLEERLANYFGCKYTVAVSSATAGLHLSYLATGVNKKKKIITSPNTFVSTANASLFCNSLPYFSDISISTLGLCPDILEYNLKKNKNISTIVPVHFSGVAQDMEKIFKIAKNFNLNVIEDASHCVGSEYPSGYKVGSCKYSDISVFSFHPVKILAGGEGGVITTNNRKIYNNLMSLRSHGIEKEKLRYKNKSVAYTNGKINQWYYEMSTLGFHYRQTDIHAGLIDSQLDRINIFLEKRKKLCKRYDDFFSSKKNIILPQFQYRSISSNHLYILRINYKKIGVYRNQLMMKLRNANIISQVHYIPVPMQLYYKKLGYKMSSLKNCKKYYDECLSIPLYFDLSFDEQDYVMNTIDNLIK